MSADSRTRQYPPPPPAPPSRSGFNPVTLAIAAISAVAAAIVVSKIWSGGTLMATAMTPVIVAVVKEMLERPAQKIPVTVSRLSSVRREDPDALVVEEFEPGHESEPSEVSVYSARGHKWKLAALTGLLAAVVAIAALTLPELVAGHSILGGGHRTTIFRGHSAKTRTTTTQDTQTQTVTQTQPTETVTQTVPTVTQTVPAQTQTTPAQTQQAAPTTTTPPSGGATTPTTPAP